MTNSENVQIHRSAHYLFTHSRPMFLAIFQELTYVRFGFKIRTYSVPRAKNKCILWKNTREKLPVYTSHLVFRIFLWNSETDLRNLKETQKFFKNNLIYVWMLFLVCINALKQFFKNFEFFHFSKHFWWQWWHFSFPFFTQFLIFFFWGPYWLTKKKLCQKDYISSIALRNYREKMPH